MLTFTSFANCSQMYLLFWVTSSTEQTIGTTPFYASSIELTIVWLICSYLLIWKKLNNFFFFNKFTLNFTYPLFILLLWYILISWLSTDEQDKSSGWLTAKEADGGATGNVCPKGTGRVTFSFLSQTWLCLNLK